MLNTGDGRFQRQIESDREVDAARYARANSVWHSRQLTAQANQIGGWDAFHAAQANQDYMKRPHSAAWLAGWRAAQEGEARPEDRPPVDLCPGVLRLPKHVGPDPDHIAPRLEWVCPHCRWRLAVGTSYTEKHAPPPYVPLHGQLAISVTEHAQPIGGQSADWLLGDPGTP
jgi:hypothetical protein